MGGGSRRSGRRIRSASRTGLTARLGDGGHRRRRRRRADGAAPARGGLVVDPETGDAGIRVAALRRRRRRAASTTSRAEAMTPTCSGRRGARSPARAGLGGRSDGRHADRRPRARRLDVTVGDSRTDVRGSRTDDLGEAVLRPPGWTDRRRAVRADRLVADVDLTLDGWHGARAGRRADPADRRRGDRRRGRAPPRRPTSPWWSSASPRSRRPKPSTRPPWPAGRAGRPGRRRSRPPPAGRWSWSTPRPRC